MKVFNHLYSTNNIIDKNVIKFIKCNVLGNDFVLIDSNNEENIINKINVRKILDRKLGIGADDLIIIKSDGKNHFIEVINPDSSIAELCGNALSCSGVYLANKYSIFDHEFVISTSSGIKKLMFKKSNNSIQINLGKPKFIEHLKNRNLTIDNINFTIHHLFVGVPHTVIFLDDINKVDPERIAFYMFDNKFIQYSTNVMLVRKINSGHIFIKSWERGGTGYSSACGTGAAASVVSGILYNDLERKTIVEFKNGIINVEWSVNNDIVIENSANFDFFGYWFIKD